MGSCRDTELHSWLSTRLTGRLRTLFALGEVQVSAVQTTGFFAGSSTRLALNKRQGHRPSQHFLFFFFFFSNRAHLLEFKMLWRISNSHLRQLCDGVRCVCATPCSFWGCGALPSDMNGAFSQTGFRTWRWMADVTSCWSLSKAKYPKYVKDLENNIKLPCPQTSRI